MNKLTYYIIALLFPVLQLFGVVSINQTRPYDFNFQESGSTELILNFSLDDISLATVNYRDEFYTELAIRGANYHHMIGTPKLPLIRKMIKIPENSRIEYDIFIQSEEKIDLSQTNFPNPVLPVQPFRRKSDTDPIQTVVNHEIYEKDDYYSPGVVNAHAPFTMGGITGVMLDFFPVSYNPVRHSLKLITSATITVKIIKEPILQKSAAKSPFQHPDLERIARDIFINYDETESQIKSTAPLNFLVIAGDQFADNAELQTYLRWKRQTGYRVALHSIADIGNEVSDIKNFILSEYNGDMPPAYVLLVGDVADVPAWNGDVGKSETDAPYARIDEDFIPDLMIGRFSISSNEELSAVIHKSMNYEQCSFDNLDALNRITFISTDDEENWWIAEGSHDYVIDNHLNPRGIQSDHIKGHLDGNTVAIHQTLNGGRTICHYSGHGDSLKWQGPVFRQSDISALNVNTVPSFVISNACLTGSFAEAAECFGESWIRAEDRGAFAFIGASNSSYWEPDDIMERGMYDGFFINGETSIGAMLYRGLFEVYLQTAAVNDTLTYQYYYDVYNILGDPSIKPWVGVPKETYVDYNPIVALNAGHYSVSVMNESGVVENAAVTLVQNETIAAYGVTGIDGTVILPIGFETLQLGDLLLTVTGEQQIPFMDTLQVIDPLLVTLEPDSIPVGVVSDISVTVLDDSLSAVEGAEIYVSGWTVQCDSLLGSSDSTGVLQFQLLPRYGESLKIKGKLPGEDSYFFAKILQVSNASPFSNPEIAVGVKQFNVENSLVPGHIGQIHGFADQGNFMLAAFGCGVDTLAANDSIQVLPDTIGIVVAAMLKPWYEVFEKTVTVSKAYGSVTGLVTDTVRLPLVDVLISGYLYPDTVNPAFSGTTNTNGEFSYQLPVEIGYYQIRAQLFGYQTQTIIDTIRVASNVFNIEMPEAPRVSVSGRVSGGIHDRPLDAEIMIDEFSSGTGEYYTSLEILSANGGVYEIKLPYGEYEFTASSMRFIAETLPVYVGDQALEINFQLDTTRASILLIDDDSGKRSIDKNSTFTIDCNEGKGGSAVEIQNMLEPLGYYVMKTGFDEETEYKLHEFNMVISSSGSNISPVLSSSYRSMLEFYVANGGKLLVEGGEVGYDAAYDPGYPSFKEKVLHINEWKADTAKSLYCLLTYHDLVTQPNKLDYEIGINYSSYGDEDACTPASDARVIYFNNNQSSQGGIILYEDAENIYGAKIIFYTFAFDKLAGEMARNNLLENTIEFLLAEPDPLKGDVNKDGSVNILDMVKIVNFILYPDQQPDEYEWWAADLNSDQDINVLDLVLVINKLLGREGFTKPADFVEGKLEIFQQNGQIRYKASKLIAGLEIQFDSECVPVFSNQILENEKITARIEKNKLLLYSVNGNNILAEEGIIATLSSNGKIQKVIAADHFGNNVAVSVGLLPGKFALHRNYPNPFNASTVICFDIPVETHVTVEIFDILGRKVGILMDEYKKPGFYEIFWDGCDNNSKILPSGVYFYAITAGQFHRLHKMALVK